MILSMSQITDIIKRLRAEPYRLTQCFIARKTGIPQPRISRWEAGNTPPAANDVLKLLALAREVGADIEIEPLAAGKEVAANGGPDFIDGLGE